MKNIKIVSNPCTYEVDEFFIFGEFYFDIDGLFFPCFEWTDLVSSVLTMWLQVLKHGIENKSRSVELCFMDGPYSFQLERNGQDLAYLSAYNDDKLIYSNILIGIEDFYNEVLNKAYTLIIKYKGFNLSSLKKSYNAFIKTMKKHGYTNFPNQ